MTFAELTRVMLGSMDFFELRRTAARYGVPYQGVRRTKLLRDLERTITTKNAEAIRPTATQAAAPVRQSAVKAPASTATVRGRGSNSDKNRSMKINTYTSGNRSSRVYDS